MKKSWRDHFLGLAQFKASKSKDPSTKCGAVIVGPDMAERALGFNGFPRGCDDSPELYADRETKLLRVVHAEANAIAQAARAGAMASIGAMMKIALFAPLGTTISFISSFRPSAIGWIKPQGPTRFGPIRTCM